MLLSTYSKSLLKNNATSFKNNFLAYSQGVLVNLSDIPILGYEKMTQCATTSLRFFILHAVEW